MLLGRRYVVQYTVAALVAAALPASSQEALNLETGTRHLLDQPGTLPFPAVGCLDHRTLMFVVGESEGEDPDAAKLLAQRDCRPLVPDQVYIRCGPGGWAYPAKGERVSYASYCRAGVKDVPLYVLDIQMKKIEEGTDPSR
jgi:hypothetical protein